MQEYLLKVSKGAANDVASFLALDKAPSHVRLSTLAPLSKLAEQGPVIVAFFPKAFTGG